MIGYSTPVAITSSSRVPVPSMEKVSTSSRSGLVKVNLIPSESVYAEDEFGVETDVYDNGFNQEIGGGSIVIHTKKK